VSITGYLVINAINTTLEHLFFLIQLSV